MGGALLGHLLTTIDPKMFTFMLTFNILLVVVLGGIGSITGSAIAAVAVTILMELLRFLDGPINLGFAALALFHYYLQSKADVSDPVLMTGFFLMLMLYRALIPRLPLLRIQPAVAVLVEFL